MGRKLRKVGRAIDIFIVESVEWGLLVGESARGVFDFRWEVGAFIGVDGCEGVIGGRECAGIIWISSMKSGIFGMYLGQ